MTTITAGVQWGLANEKPAVLLSWADAAVDLLQDQASRTQASSKPNAVKRKGPLRLPGAGLDLVSLG